MMTPSHHITDTWIYIFTVGLLTMAKKRNQLRCLSRDKWIMKMWHNYTMTFYPTIMKNKIMVFQENGWNYRKLCRICICVWEDGVERKPWEERKREEEKTQGNEIFVTWKQKEGLSGVEGGNQLLASSMSASHFTIGTHEYGWALGIEPRSSCLCSKRIYLPYHLLRSQMSLCSLHCCWFIMCKTTACGSWFSPFTM